MKQLTASNPIILILLDASQVTVGKLTSEKRLQVAYSLSFE